MNPPYYWTKRLGPKHIIDQNCLPSTIASTTFCGKPLLGNNYAYNGREDAEACGECAQAFDAETDPKRTT